VAEMTPGQSDCAVRLLGAAKLNWNSPSESPNNCRQENPNIINYHSDPKEIISIFWIRVITDWCRQQAKTHS
jgi:hypothetical protein